jgi:hypothetical protein
MEAENREPPNPLDQAWQDLLMEVEHQLRATRHRFFGAVTLELQYQSGNLTLFKVSSDRTRKVSVDIR